MAEHVIDYQSMLGSLLKDLSKVTLLAMEQQGVDKQSNLAKSVNYVEVKEGVQLEVAYYYTYVSTGRKRGIKKVPITALIQYIKREGISPRSGQSINQLAFAIQTHIYKQGINPKNYIDKVVDVAGELAQEQMLDKLAVSIADELELMFEK